MACPISPHQLPKTISQRRQPDWMLGSLEDGWVLVGVVLCGHAKVVRRHIFDSITSDACEARDAEYNENNFYLN